MSGRIHLPQAPSWEEFKPGTWFRTRGPEGAVYVSCGYCGERASLANHTISPEGVVDPSLVCPSGCGWHFFVRLRDWPG